MRKIECPNCRSKIKLSESQTRNGGERFVIKCSKCNNEVNIESQPGPQFKISKNNSPDGFWNKLF